MPSDFEVSEDAIKLVEDIIAKYNITDVSDIEYQRGSEVGDGYISKTVAVDIINGKKTFKVFLKCALNVKSTEIMPIEKLYFNEIYFYDVVYPAYKQFSIERGCEDALRNVPICYGTSHNIVALENLRERNFTLYGRKKTMNDQHISMVLKAFAQVHAISFAFKDQKREEYDKIVEKTYDFFSDVAEGELFKSMNAKTIEDFLALLDPVKDKFLLDKCSNLAETLPVCMASANKTLNEYSILTQGDCHCNNMMFCYEDENKENPLDVMLIDWQLIRPASPVFDIAYFFYVVAAEGELNNLHGYLKLYHKELSKRIRHLGSDPDLLYPFEVLEKEWKQHGKYGFATTFNILRVMLSEQDEVFDIEKIDFENPANIEQSIPKLRNEAEYNRRMKLIAEHMAKNDFI